VIAGLGLVQQTTGGAFGEDGIHVALGDIKGNAETRREGEWKTGSMTAGQRPQEKVRSAIIDEYTPSIGMNQSDGPARQHMASRARRCLKRHPTPRTKLRST